ncbi:alanine--tRNA ligase [bacterium]|nr:alanine--tRNA ligase [bacterium]
MKSDELRALFLSFFEKKGHKILPGISLVPTDPSLLLTGAGVVPFRGIIEGRERATYKRVATCQRCVRTNDIEKVGLTSRHLTFFEMLGNFSFGDYYKKESLSWGWEFLVDVLHLPKEKLWVSVYEKDEEARKIWLEDIGIAPEHLVSLGKEDNFWGPVGATGACGPSSEIYYDFGEDVGCGSPDCKPGCDCDRFIELWNHVFTEFFLDENGELHPLPRKNIDTGMGLERLAAAVQGGKNCFDADVFQPILHYVEEMAGKEVAVPRKRIIADHIRAGVFLIADGVLPSNEGRGYVLRRILRRAEVQGILSGLPQLFLHRLVPVVVRVMKGGYPYLVDYQDFILEEIKREEERFQQTLNIGLSLLEDMLSSSKFLNGEDVFRLYDTYGFPLELTLELARERGAEVDIEGFKQALEKQRERARLAVEQEKLPPIYSILAQNLPSSEFIGYDNLKSEAEVIALIKEGEKVEELEGEGEILLDRTPFYAEKGGQVADKGHLRFPNGEALIKDVQMVGSLIVHKAEVKGILKNGMKVEAIVDEERRKAIQRHHTATHLLHAALKRVLGPFVNQAGSYVGPDRLRFDFSWTRALNQEELLKIEEIVNAKIMEDIKVEISFHPLKEALEMGAVALFGEKYGEIVRVVRIGDFSIELCAGCHTSSTGEIGLFKILEESSIGAGLRRIEGVCGFSALNYLRNLEDTLKNSAWLLQGSIWEVPQRLENILERLKTLEEEKMELERKLALKDMESLISKVKEIKGVKVLTEKVEGMSREGLKELADSLIEKLKNGIVLLGTTASQDSVIFVCKITPDVLERGIQADKLVRETAKLVGGGGGGSPLFAQAGGKNPEKLEEALDFALQLLENTLT